MALGVQVLVDNRRIDGISKVGVECTWDLAVGEHFFDPISMSTGKRDDGI